MIRNYYYRQSSSAPAVRKDTEFVRGWLGHVNTTGLGTTYRDTRIAPVPRRATTIFPEHTGAGVDSPALWCDLDRIQVLVTEVEIDIGVFVHGNAIVKN